MNHGFPSNLIPIEGHKQKPTGNAARGRSPRYSFVDCDLLKFPSITSPVLSSSLLHLTCSINKLNVSRLFHLQNVDIIHCFKQWALTFSQDT